MVGKDDFISYHPDDNDHDRYNDGGHRATDPSSHRCPSPFIMVAETNELALMFTSSERFRYDYALFLLESKKGIIVALAERETQPVDPVRPRRLPESSRTDLRRAGPVFEPGRAAIE